MGKKRAREINALQKKSQLEKKKRVEGEKRRMEKKGIDICKDLRVDYIKYLKNAEIQRNAHC